MVYSNPGSLASHALPALPVEVWDQIWEDTLDAIGSVVLVLLPLDRERTERRECLRDTEVKIYGYSDVLRFGSICFSARRHMLARRQHLMTLDQTLLHEKYSKIHIDFNADIFVLDSLKEHFTPLVRAFPHHHSHDEFARLVKYLVIPSATLRRLSGLDPLRKEVRGPYSSVIPLLCAFTITQDDIADEADAKSLERHITRPCPSDRAGLFWSQEPETSGVYVGKFRVNEVYIDAEVYRGCKLLLAHMDPGFSHYLYPPFNWNVFPPRIKVWQRNRKQIDGFSRVEM